jgi:hypothetical protein
MLAALALGTVPRSAAAGAVIDLEWEDLLPEGQTSIPSSLQGVIPHDPSDMAAQQPASTGVRTDWNGKIVRLPGFVVPLDFDGAEVTAFILVPFVGACVHVPPPPANQLVLVTTERPYASKSMFEPVHVTGMLGTAYMTTELAAVGYAMSADRIEPYS